jgi:hypothetical protein
MAEVVEVRVYAAQKPEFFTMVKRRRFGRVPIIALSMDKD